MLNTHPAYLCKCAGDTCQRYSRYIHPTARGRGKHTRQAEYTAHEQKRHLGLPSLVCVVSTLSDRAAQVHGVNETWGRFCDAIVYVSEAKHASPNIPVFVVGATKPRTGKSSGDGGSNGTLAHLPGITIRAWRHIRATVDERHKWFVAVRDDTYLAVGSLKLHLAALDAESSDAPRYLGRRLRLPNGLVVNSGGAGSVVLLSRVALSME